MKDKEKLIKKWTKGKPEKIKNKIIEYQKKIKNFYEDNRIITCPICGYLEEPEGSYQSGNIKCGNCENEFYIEVEVIRTFESNIIEVK